MTTTTLRFESLRVEIHDDLLTLAAAAGDAAADALNTAISERGEANLMLATGNSQLAFLGALVRIPGIAWDRVRAFHMDEYVGLRPSHTASFQRYMRDRVAALIPVKEFHYLHGDASDAQAEANRYEELLRAYPLDLCCCGIGENGHLAFNDPPADFNTRKMIHVVTLDDACRRQQVGEGHFPTLDDVPRQAISLTVPALLLPPHVLAVVPEARKAPAVQAALEGPITPDCPASILRTVSHVKLYLDRDSAALLEPPA